MINRKDLCRILEISDVTVNKYVKEGMPHELIWGWTAKKKATPMFDVTKCREWLRKKKKGKTLTNRRYGR